MVSISTIDTNSWDVMYNHLQTGAYAISTDNIYSSFNEKLVKSIGMPLVIIEPPRTGYSDVTVNGSIRQLPVTYYIEIYHSSSENLKALVDDVRNKIITGYSVFTAENLYKDKNEWFAPVEYDGLAGPNSKLHIATMEIKFRYVG